jgi:hypothetical protein
MGVDWGILSNGVAKPLDPVSALHIGNVDNEQAQQDALAQQKQDASQQAAARQQAAYSDAATKYAAGDQTGAQAALLGAGSFDGVTAVDAAQKQSRDTSNDNNGLFSGVAVSIGHLPYDQRKAALQTMKPFLTSVGIPSDQIDNFDPTDQNLAAIHGYGYTPEKQDSAAVAQQGATTNAQNADTQRAAEIREEQTPHGVSATDNVWTPGGPLVSGAPAAPAGSTPAPTGTAPAGAVTSGHLNPNAFFTQFVAPHEGGYAAHDANGQPVNYGINQGANPGVDVKSLTPGAAGDIFTQKYYNQSGAANLPPALAAVYADTYFINPARAKQFLAQSNGDPAKFMELRRQWMGNLVQTQPEKYGPYAKAWNNRNRDLIQYSQNLGSGGSTAPATSAAPNAQPGQTATAPAGQAAMVQPASGSGPTMIQSGVPKAPTPAKGALDSGTVDNLAWQSISTGQMPALGMGNPAARAQVLNRKSELQAQYHITDDQVVQNGAGYKSDAASLTQLQKQHDLIVGNEGTVKQNFGQWLARSKELPDPNGMPLVQSVINPIAHGLGNTHVLPAEGARRTAVDEYARVMTGGPTGSGHTTDNATKNYDTAFPATATYAQKQAAVAQATTDMENRKSALETQIASTKQRIASRANPGAYGGQAVAAKPLPAPVNIASPQDAARLAPGTRFITPDGTIRVKH